MKRCFDFLVSIFLLVILSPLLIITAILIKLTSKGPLFFKQQRVGKDGKLFSVYKFRTMIDKVRSFDKQTFKGDAEVTTIGGIIRRLKIDELPQLINSSNNVKTLCIGRSNVSTS